MPSSFELAKPARHSIRWFLGSETYGSPHPTAEFWELLRDGEGRERGRTERGEKKEIWKGRRRKKNKRREETERGEGTEGMEKRKGKTC